MKLRQVVMRDQISSEGLMDMIKELGDTSDKRMVEIGSFIGESTVMFAEHFKEVTAIDPFKQGYDEQDPTSRFDFNEVYEEYLKRTSPYKNIKTVVATSDDAIDQLKPKYDFIYIDGIHQYENVKRDIENYLPLLKKGGVIGGHDYGGYWSGVKQAVDEIIGQPDKTFKDTSWIKKI